MKLLQTFLWCLQSKLTSKFCSIVCVMYITIFFMCRQAKWMKQEPEYYCADPDLPIFERIHASRKRLYSVQDVAQILLSPSLLSSKFVCSKIPTSICENVSFIIHLDRLEDKKDVLSDDMGSWKNNGVDTTHIRVNSFSDSEVESVEKCDADDDNGVPTYSIKRVYRTHTTDGSLKKLTAYIYGKETQVCCIMESKLTIYYCEIPYSWLFSMVK